MYSLHFCHSTFCDLVDSLPEDVMKEEHDKNMLAKEKRAFRVQTYSPDTDLQCLLQGQIAKKMFVQLRSICLLGDASRRTWFISHVFLRR